MITIGLHYAITDIVCFVDADLEYASQILCTKDNFKIYSKLF